MTAVFSADMSVVWIRRSRAAVSGRAGCERCRAASMAFTSGPGARPVLLPRLRIAVYIRSMSTASSWSSRRWPRAGVR